jgi:ABC-2 type transport system permease protein
MLLLVPALLLVLYGYALSFDVRHIKTAVLDEDNTHESRQFLDSLFQNPYFDRSRTLARRAEADALLHRGVVRVVVVVPRGMARQLARGEEVHIQALVDGSDATAAATTVGYLEALAERQTRLVRLQAFERMGLPATLARAVPEPRIWFNPDLKSARFLVPGLIGMLLMISAVIATSLSIVREKERETIEQIMVSPVRRWELLAGKTLPYVLICLLTMGMILILGYFLFGITVRGSYTLLALATLLFLFAALGMGMLISSATRSQQVAFQIATISSMLPSIVLSGLIFPIQNMPTPVQAITLVVVPRYFVSALRKIILKGAAFEAVWPEFAALLALGLMFNLLAAHRTRRSV